MSSTHNSELRSRWKKVDRSRAVGGIRRRFTQLFPSPTQLKYLSNYLSRKEVRALRIAGTVIVLSLILMGVQFTRDFVVRIPDDGGEYTEALVGSPKFVNPILAQTNDTDLDLVTLIFTGLMKPGEGGTMAPDVAEKVDISEDQKEYTFTLRQDVFFHNGQQLTADDVQFTYQSILDPAFRSPLRTRFQGVGFQKIDDFTIKFILQEPFAPFLEAMTFGILPQHLWQQVDPENAVLASYNLEPTGTGPFAYNGFTRNSSGKILSYTLKRNESYYGGHVSIDSVVFKFYDSFDSAILAVTEKKVDGVRFVPKSQRADVKKANSNIEFTSLRLPQYTAVFFNQTNALLKNHDVREALALATDKDRIIREALENEGEAIHAPILPGYVGYNPEIRIYGYDIEAAKRLLEEKGWKLAEPVEPAKPVRWKDSVELAFTISTLDQPEYLQAIEILKESWEEIGVRVEVKTYSSEEILPDVIKPRSYDALLFGEIVGNDPDPYPFWHSSQSKDPGLNLAIFYNRSVDQLLEEARKTNDVEQRRPKYLHFQNILADELPAIFLYNPTYSYGIHKKIKGIEKNIYITEPADRFRKIPQWYIKTDLRVQFDRQAE